MFKSLFVCAILGVLVISVKCNLISVCLDDKKLRVDCRVQPKPSKINSYEFSWSSGSKELVINTNGSGSAADLQFKDKSQVEALLPHGYRMTLQGFTDKLPHNTTYMCKISGVPATVTLENAKLLQCSAVSMFLQSSCIWTICLLLFFCNTQT
ncbi:thy-1 membrane glycoprotein-like [Thalassophryne amazonica]|uniref:thy-1 membrane glycoprotein-like n=1 Tax=Thalassophryne amazonica TaxID=390379 RepID=UPI001472495B|nr:thy-1 membrane glycoprotein-like [Thalassophryne amazonica]